MTRIIKISKNKAGLIKDIERMRAPKITYSDMWVLKLLKDNKLAKPLPVKRGLWYLMPLGKFKFKELKQNGKYIYYEIIERK